MSTLAMPINASAFCPSKPSSNENPFCSLLPSSFPHGTPQHVIDAFKIADKDGNGLIDDRELKMVLSGCGSSAFSLRTIHLLMYSFTGTNTKTIGRKEFVHLFTVFQQWKDIFERHDTDHNGKINSCELQQTLHTLGYPVSPTVLNLLVMKYDKSGQNYTLNYDNFIECCITVKGLTEKFKEKETTACPGSATFTYEGFLMSVLPFIIA